MFKSYFANDRSAILNLKKFLWIIPFFMLVPAVSAKSPLKQDAQYVIAKELTDGLDKCSSLAFTNIDILLNSAELQKYCTYPYEIVSRTDIFDENVLNENLRMILKTAAATGEGLIVRNKVEQGIYVDSADRKKYFSAPYDVVTTKQMPKILCVWLMIVYDENSKLFDRTPTCKAKLEEKDK